MGKEEQCGDRRKERGKQVRDRKGCGHGHKFNPKTGYIKGLGTTLQTSAVKRNSTKGAAIKEFSRDSGNNSQGFLVEKITQDENPPIKSGDNVKKGRRVDRGGISQKMGTSAEQVNRGQPGLPTDPRNAVNCANNGCLHSAAGLHCHLEVGRSKGLAKHKGSGEQQRGSIAKATWSARRETKGVVNLRQDERTYIQKPKLKCAIRWISGCDIGIDATWNDVERRAACLVSVIQIDGSFQQQVSNLTQYKSTGRSTVADNSPPQFQLQRRYLPQLRIANSFIQAYKP
ncbi:hypothetical protein C8R46DRAFT_1026534 [Mycena filopes]|nr:hypothetical protein C8R46DRAFT_1026534 [Mycena filopes]